ncbi:MAG: hypothetical protein ACJ739_14685 [Acidimicrobiales bacterium]
MEDELPPGAEGAEGADGADGPPAVGGIPPLPPELSARERELRSLVDAGAGSPEELRALAAKLKEQRSYEETLWQREVKPALIKSKKKRMSLADLRPEGGEGDRHTLVLGLTLLGGVVLLFLIATLTSFLVLLVGAAAVLVYAWYHGLRSGKGGAPEPPAPEAPD